MDMRYVQCFSYLVEPVSDAVFGQHVLNLKPRRVQQIAQGVLVLLPVHPAKCGPAAGDVAREVGGDQGSG